MKISTYVTIPEKVQAIQLTRDNFEEVRRCLLEYGYKSGEGFDGEELYISIPSVDDYVYLWDWVVFRNGGMGINIDDPGTFENTYTEEKKDG